MNKKICAYARVSRDDLNINNQMMKLKGYAEVRDFEIVQVYTDKASGKDTNRIGFKKMLNDLETNPLGIEAVLIYKLDRIGRSLSDLIKMSQWFKNHKIELISITDNIDTTTPSGKLFFHITGAFAEYERDLISERTKAGLDRARSEGRIGGRKRANLNKIEILRLRAEGIPLTKIAKKYGVCVMTVYNYLNKE